jgi:dinuclear metal center YbgI/SA1388 family protein
LSKLIGVLEALAPLELAEAWDNVGLLVDPRESERELEVERALLTIDLSEAVLAEALGERVECVIAYHPPLFQPRRRLSRRVDAALFAAAAAGLAIYSPHTALDSVAGGVNDWLISGFGAGRVEALKPALGVDDNAELKLVIFVPASHVAPLRSALAAVGAGAIGAYRECSFTLQGEGTFFGDESTNPTVGEKGRLERAAESRLEMVCPRAVLAEAARAIARVHPYEEPAWEVYPLAPKPSAGAGVGRRVTLAHPAPLEALVERAKRHLGLARLRLAACPEHARDKLISRVAVCAGAGGSVLGSNVDCDLFVTGELRHHDVLAHLAAGRSVMLCEHSNSERGYLPHFRERILHASGASFELLIAKSDREPLDIV